MNTKKIAIIGLGGVGGYFGFKISQANELYKKNHITFVSRNETYQIVKQNGLTLLSEEHPNKITFPNATLDTISEITAPDLVLICVKEYDLENVCKQLKKTIVEKTVLIPMMNGVDIYDRIRKIIPKNTILPSCIYVASHIKEKGIVEHKGKTGKMFIGRDPENYSENIDWIINLFSESKIDCALKDNSSTEIWTKFFFITSFGLVSAKHNSSIGAVCEDILQKKEATEIMKEMQLIAKAKGINLPETIITQTFEKAATFPPQTPTSLQLDIHSKKENNELDLFAKPIIEYGIDLNIKTPFTQKIYLEIKEKIKSNR